MSVLLPDNYINRHDQNDRALSSPSTASSTSHDSVTISQVSKPTIKRLYISHFLSYWNSRVFEFGSVLFLASIFPGTILPLSVYALARGIAAVLFSPAVGRYIDVGERLRVVRLSIRKGAYFFTLKRLNSKHGTSLSSNPGSNLLMTYPACVYAI